MSQPPFVDGHPEPEWLSAWHDGEITGEAAAALKAHLDGCATCQARLADFARLDEVAPWLDRGLPDGAEWAGIDERLRARMDEEIAVPGLATQGRRRIEPPGFRLRWALATAAGLAVLVIGSRVLFDRDWGMGGILGPSPTLRTAVEPPPMAPSSTGTMAANEEMAESATGTTQSAEADGHADLLAREATPGDEATTTGDDTPTLATAPPRQGTPTPVAAPLEMAANENRQQSAAAAKAGAGRAESFAEEGGAANDSLAAARARIAAGEAPDRVVNDLLARFEAARAAAGPAGAAAPTAALESGADRDAARSRTADQAGEAPDPCREALLLGRAALTLAVEYRIDISRRLTPEALAEYDRCAD